MEDILRQLRQFLKKKNTVRIYLNKEIVRGYGAEVSQWKRGENLNRTQILNFRPYLLSENYFRRAARGGDESIRGGGPPRLNIEPVVGDSC